MEKEKIRERGKNMTDLFNALKEHAAIVEGLREEYTQDKLTLKAVRKDHPELNFMDDDEIETIIQQANEHRCKKADPQGPYIDRLRTKYPFRIIAHGGYEAVLKGVQTLLEGQEMPVYRFPGGKCVLDFSDIEKIIEW